MIRKELPLVVVLASLPLASFSQPACESDLYLGYYLENPINNPEDPVPGSLFLNLPSQDGAFAGEMLFTYLGCQTQNIGTVSGLRQGNRLSGDWAGTVDGTNQRGGFTGSAQSPQGFAGDYTVDGGKQLIEVADCATYFIAALGTWVLNAIDQPSADDDLLSYLDGQVSWNLLQDAVAIQCQLVDVAKANCGQPDAVLWQEIAGAAQRQLAVPTQALNDGDEYAIACGQFDEQLTQLAFSKQLFVQGGEAGGDPAFADGFETVTGR